MFFLVYSASYIEFVILEALASKELEETPTSPLAKHWSETERANSNLKLPCHMNWRSQSRTVIANYCHVIFLIEHGEGSFTQAYG